MRLIALFAITTACARPSPIEPGADPACKPLPDAEASAQPSKVGERACEPIVRCGVWSGCVWLERADDVRYRSLGGPEKGFFVRRHDCWPADASSTLCAVHCTGADGGAPCVDGLHPEIETCTGAAAPHPDATLCQIGAGICGSLI